MDTTDKPTNCAHVEIKDKGEGEACVILEGTFDAQTTGKCWHELDQKLRPLRVRSLEVDASRLHVEGGIGITLVRYLSEGGMTPGARVNVRGLNQELLKLMETFTAEDFRTLRPPKPLRVRLPEEIGASVRSLLRELREEIVFTGRLFRSLLWGVRHPGRMRWREIRRVVEKSGANALPVVALFSALVGLVLALEAARPLRKLGSQIFIADLIGLSAIRDTGPLVTAIMLAGRSASAFAAELGTMKVNEELNAMETMGLDPIRYLVLQRVLAAMALMPLLTVYASLMAAVGGMLVMWFLGFPFLVTFHQMAARIHLSDFVVGLSKALCFGLIVGGVGCLRGLQTGEGPRSVGTSTTRAVVASILLIILVNTVFSMVQYFF